MVGEPLRPAPLRPRANFHYLGRIPKSGKKDHPQKPCKQCIKRKDTRFMCMYCPDNPPLCLEPCFLAYHKGQGVAAGNETDDEFDY